MFWIKSRRIKGLKQWLRAYNWRYFDLVMWARERDRSEEEWIEKINSHRAVLNKMKAPWNLAALEGFDPDGVGKVDADGIWKRVS